MAANLSLRAASVEDVPAMVDVFFSAFQDSELNARCFPASAPESPAYFDAWIRRNLASPADHMLVVEQQQLPSGESPGTTVIAGWARWGRRPRPETQPEPVVFTADMFPPTGNGALAASFFQFNHDATHRIAGHLDHWFLSTLVVDRAWQRRGVGKMLLRWGVDRADEEGWAAYLNATEEAKGLYESVGFRNVSESVFEELKLRSYHMLRAVSNPGV